MWIATPLIFEPQTERRKEQMFIQTMKEVIAALVFFALIFVLPGVLILYSDWKKGWFK